MGRAYLFECPRCRLRVTVAGGLDRGAHCFTQTVMCRDCATLHDVPFRLRLAVRDIALRHRLTRGQFLNRPLRLPVAPAGWNRRLPFGGLARFRWVSVPLRCPVSPRHRVVPWHAPGKCPRCGHRLDRTLMPAREWE